ncbi:hypothetical protein [Streptomyces sp. IBSBF 2435]|uniref:hypothetical protein n=1 Tax=Streptomyces sp. IBSBF 2435 TaxID=2903531 RepID=UPI002FDC5393
MATTDIPGRVQAAADTLRHLALAATPGSWTALPVAYDAGKQTVWEVQATATRGVVEDVVTHQSGCGGGIEHEPDARWITALQPNHGLLLADYLHSLAARLRMVQAAGIVLDENADLGMLALVDALTSEQA